MRLLPPASSPERVVALSIFLSQDSRGEFGTGAGALSESMLDRLTRLIGSSELPVTWAVGESLFGELHERFESQTAVHELAVLGDDSWLGQTKSRGTIVRKLNAVVEAAATMERTATSLLLQGVALDADFDLLAKHGINLVARDEADARDSKTTASADRTTQVRTLRFGVWELATTVKLPRPSSRLGLVGGNVGRLIDRAVSRGELSHVVIDGQAILDNPGELRSLERLLERLAFQQRQGGLRVQTLSSISAQLGPSQVRSSATSILRAPAA